MLTPRTHAPTQLRSRRGVTTLCLSVVTAGALALGTLSAATAQAEIPNSTASASPAAAAPAPTVSTSHPYSAPIWYPVRDKVYVDCVFTNPGCESGANHHGDWTMDVVLETLNTVVPKNPGVYAMGAGKLRIGNAHGAKCQDGHTDYGTWVWIDHGGGVVSRYGHLNKILVKNGALVAAGQEIATMGTTGKGSNCSVPYLDFQVRHGGISGKRVQVKTLRACDLQTPATYRNWPSYLDATDYWRQSHPLFSKPARSTYYSVWNQVPERSVDFPAVSGSCIPSGTPQTPSTPTATTVSRSGSGALTVQWKLPAGGPKVAHVQVNLAMYHTSTKTWDHPQNEQYVTLPGTATSYKYTKLANGRQYRAQVTFMNSIGNSKTTKPVQQMPAAPPAAPRIRHAFATQASKTASLHFQWSRGKENGVLIKYFQVQVRRTSPKAETTWEKHRSARTVTHYYWSGMRKHATYVMRIRAVSSLGNSGWVSRTVRT